MIMSLFPAHQGTKRIFNQAVPKTFKCVQIYVKDLHIFQDEHYFSIAFSNLLGKLGKPAQLLSAEEDKAHEINQKNLGVD